MFIKIEKIEIIKEYSVEESNIFDFRLLVSLSEGIWPFRSFYTLDIVRYSPTHNQVFENIKSNKRLLMTHYQRFFYTDGGGEEVKEKYRLAIEKEMQNLSKHLERKTERDFFKKSLAKIK